MADIKAGHVSPGEKSSRWYMNSAIRWNKHSCTLENKKTLLVCVAGTHTHARTHIHTYPYVRSDACNDALIITEGDVWDIYWWLQQFITDLTQTSVIRLTKQTIPSAFLFLQSEWRKPQSNQSLFIATILHYLLDVKTGVQWQAIRLILLLRGNSEGLLPRRFPGKAWSSCW